jgi:hypothetical protein
MGKAKIGGRKVESRETVTVCPVGHTMWTVRYVPVVGRGRIMKVCECTHLRMSAK